MDNKNQPAFPQSTEWLEEYKSEFTGLTKREYFAGLAMQGLCAGLYRFGNQDGEGYQVEGPGITSIAEQAVEIADALLNELNK